MTSTGGRVGKRLRSWKGLKAHAFFDSHRGIKQAKVWFVTVTYDMKRPTIREAGGTIGEDLNRGIRNIRKKFGRVSHLRCWEASRKGYPHIHALMIFHDSKLRVTRIQGRNQSLEKEEFDKSTHSCVDVPAIKIEEGIKYVIKSLTKISHESPTHSLTLALCWLFRKRAFAVSGDVLESLKVSIKTSRVPRPVQLDLQGAELKLNVEWIFIGIFSAKRLGIERNEWWKVIANKEALCDILSEAKVV
jgi:hypothetical protein